MIDDTGVQRLIDTATEQDLPLGEVTHTDDAITMTFADWRDVAAWADRLERPFEWSKYSAFTGFASDGYAFTATAPISNVVAFEAELTAWACEQAAAGATVLPMNDLTRETFAPRSEGGIVNEHNADTPVVIRATVEQMIECVDYQEIPRTEWDAMTPAQRRAYLEDFGAETMNGQGGYGYGIESGAPDSDLEDVPVSAAALPLGSVVATTRIAWIKAEEVLWLSTFDGEEVNNAHVDAMLADGATVLRAGDGK